MLVVMFMIMNRAKDPHTWEWLTNEPAAETEDTERDVKGDDEAAIDDSQTQDSYGVSGIESKQIQADESFRPTDQDPEESDAAREEFQAISDRAPMLPEEMPSYWRLLNWARNQSIDELQRRARKSVTLTEFAEAPDKNRGELVHLRLHVMRSLTYDTPESPIGVKRLYEAWGWSDESGPWLYCVVFPERPPGMPIGPNAESEISFDGYFLKLLSYESRLSNGKPLFAPLLLGRIVWHPIAVTTSSNAKWFWITAGVGGLAIGVVILRWVLAHSRPLQAQPGSSHDDNAVVTWLQQAEADPTHEDFGGEQTDPESQERHL
jgi:hypothetical protein